MQEQKQDWFNRWWTWYKWRAKHLLSRVWFVLATYTVFIAILYTAFVIFVAIRSHGNVPLDIVEDFNMLMNVLIVALPISLGVLLFLFLFFLSLSPLGRRIAEQLFHYKEFTELQQYKKDMNLRLENIETTLKDISSKVITEDKVREIFREEISKHEIDKYIRHTQIDEMAKKLIDSKQQSEIDKTNTDTT